MDYELIRLGFYLKNGMKMKDQDYSGRKGTFLLVMVKK